MKSLQLLKTDIEKHCLKLNRNPNDIRVVVASKYFSIDQIQAFYDAGVRDFGENRVQDALEKIEHLPQDIRWHFLGHLQSNKINKVMGKFDLIHSIDSLQLAEKLNRQLSSTQKVLLQIKTTEEATKTGFSVEEFLEVYPKLKQLQHLQIEGLMTLAPREDLEKAHLSFETLNELKKRLNQPHWQLSMGMSQDFQIALEHGSTLIRIGRKLIA